jgi:hypothetical protein
VRLAVYFASHGSFLYFPTYLLFRPKKKTQIPSYHRLCCRILYIHRSSRRGSGGRRPFAAASLVSTAFLAAALPSPFFRWTSDKAQPTYSRGFSAAVFLAMEIFCSQNAIDYDDG